MKTAIILVIDDDEDVRVTLGEDLVAAGHIPVFAEEAQEAIQAARFELPDLILLDLRFPGGGGLEVLQQLQESPTTAGIPVIVFSGQKSDTLAAEALRLGARTYVQKSFTSTRLDEAIQKLLETDPEPAPTVAMLVPPAAPHLSVLQGGAAA
jgi:CheY-like chemotaxis protein